MHRRSVQPRFLRCELPRNATLGPEDGGDDSQTPIERFTGADQLPEIATDATPATTSSAYAASRAPSFLTVFIAGPNGQLVEDRFDTLLVVSRGLKVEKCSTMKSESATCAARR